jgi:hypothetical protein
MALSDDAGTPQDQPLVVDLTAPVLASVDGLVATATAISADGGQAEFALTFAETMSSDIDKSNVVIDVDGVDATLSDLVDAAQASITWDSNFEVVTISYTPTGAGFINLEVTSGAFLDAAGNESTFVVSTSASDGNEIEAASIEPRDVDEADNTVSELAFSGASVGITAQSPGNNVVYSLVANDGTAADADGRFTIDPSTGEIAVADYSKIDFEHLSSHTVTVKASVDSVEAYKDFTISVEDEDETLSVQADSIETIESKAVYAGANITGVSDVDATKFYALAEESYQLVEVTYTSDVDSVAHYEIVESGDTIDLVDSSGVTGFKNDNSTSDGIVPVDVITFGVYVDTNVFSSPMTSYSFSFSFDPDVLEYAGSTNGSDIPVNVDMDFTSPTVFKLVSSDKAIVMEYLPGSTVVSHTDDFGSDGVKDSFTVAIASSGSPQTIDYNNPLISFKMKLLDADTEAVAFYTPDVDGYKTVDIDPDGGVEGDEGSFSGFVDIIVQSDLIV